MKTKTTSTTKVIVKHQAMNPSTEAVTHPVPQKKPLYLHTRFLAPRRHDLDAMIEMLELYAEAKRWHFQQSASTKVKETSKRSLMRTAKDYTRAASLLEEKKACLDARSKLLESSTELIQRMLKGDSDAAVALLQAAEQITSVLQHQYRAAAELFQDHIKFIDRLPVIATLYPGWVARAKHSMKSVRLGADRISSRLKPSAYKTNNHVCRAWARWALEVLELNRANAAIWRDILPYLMAVYKTALNLVPPPAWAMKSWELPELSKQTLPQWSLLAREMIRDQVPEFHTLPEFGAEMQRIKARTLIRDDVAAGKSLKGTLQTALLDKIANAMRSIVV